MTSSGRMSGASQEVMKHNGDLAAESPSLFLPGTPAFVHVDGDGHRDRHVDGGQRLFLRCDDDEFVANLRKGRGGPLEQRLAERTSLRPCPSQSVCSFPRQG